MKPNVRIPIITCSLFLLAILVSLIYTDTKPFLLGMPFSLCFDISISFLLCFYFSFEGWVLLKGKKE